MLTSVGGSRRIAAPRDKGEVRIPALGILAGELVCFDVRPAPVGEMDESLLAKLWLLICLIRTS